jgi:arylsulfatase A-like enzyme
MTPFVSLLWAVWACSPSPAPPGAAPALASGPGGGALGAPAAAPDIVLIGVAGLRAGAPPEAGARFAAAFKDLPGTTFTQAWAQSPASWPSTVSLLTGRYPSSVPVCGFPGPPGGEVEAPWCVAVPEGAPTLPEVLGLYGYRTALLTAEQQGAGLLAPEFHEVLGARARWDDTAADWPGLAAAASAWWAADDPRPRLLVVLVGDGLAHDNPALRAQLGLPAPDAMDHHRLPQPEVILPAYVEAAAKTGAATRGLLDALPARSGRDRWAVVLGLHGQSLGESAEPSQALRPGSWNDLLLARTLHVPLILLHPGGAPGARDPRVVQLVDLLPTLLRPAGAALPAGIAGVDLRGPAPPGGGRAYAEFGDMLALVEGGYLWSLRAFFYNRSSLDPELTNFARAPLDVGRADPSKFALYDLRTDPMQRQNLVGREPARAAAMHAALVGLRTGPAAPPPGALDAERVWALRMAPADGYW